MSRLITTETTEQARARINRQLIAQGGVPHSIFNKDVDFAKVEAQVVLSDVEQAIAECDRALDAAKNAVSRCKALGVIN